VVRVPPLFDVSWSPSTGQYRYIVSEPSPS
jgi:hypothetical protein